LGTDNAYAELGLAPGASAAEVKSAWRRLVSAWHPDRNDSAGAVGRMQRINQAFETLRSAGFPADAGRRSPDRDRRRAAAGEPGPTSGAAQTDRSGRSGRTISRKIKLTLEEAGLGCTKLLRGKANSPCAACAGAGRRAIAAACPACEGTGALRQRSWYGLFGSPVDCVDCGGSGIAHQACSACQGSGKQPGYRVTVRLPPGVRSGDQLQVDARRMRADQSPGDLLIRVEVVAHPLFTWNDEFQLRCELPVNGFAWIANRAVSVPTLSGPQSLQLDRDQLDYRLPGAGFPVTRRGPRGDLLLRIVPIFPVRLSNDQEILLDQLLATTSGPDGQASDPRLAAWQKNLRDWALGLASSKP